MKYEYKPVGVCSKKFVIEIEDGVIKNLEIIGGCPGNTIGISHLVKGMKVDEAIEKLKGIECGFKGTSCPDQIALALEEFKNRKE